MILMLVYYILIKFNNLKIKNILIILHANNKQIIFILKIRNIYNIDIFFYNYILKY